MKELAIYCCSLCLFTVLWVSLLVLIDCILSCSSHTTVLNTYFRLFAFLDSSLSLTFPSCFLFWAVTGINSSPNVIHEGKRDIYIIYNDNDFFFIRSLASWIKTDGIGPQGASAQILIFDPVSLSSFSSIHWYVRENPYHWDVSGQRSFEVLYLCYCSFKLAFLSNRIDSPLQINHITRMSLTNH